MKRLTFLLTMVLLVSLLSCDYTYDSDTINTTTLTTVTFDDLDLAPESYWNGSDESGGFTSEDVWFTNNYDTTWFSWDGWSYSNITDTADPSYSNQYSAYAGHGADGSENYGTCFYASWNNNTRLTFGSVSGDTSRLVLGFYAVNTTYTALSMLNGDAFAKKFGGVDGTDQDWFLLTIHGLDETGARTGSPVTFYLADYRFNNQADDYIISEWTWVSLIRLGEVYGLEFELTSSDTGDYGMNTPAYFAMDNLVVAGRE